MTSIWVLSTSEVTRLATAADCCQGRESSLRAEVTGMLSTAVFMAMIQQHRHEPQSLIKMRYISDNLELINRGELNTRDTMIDTQTQHSELNIM